MSTHSHQGLGLITVASHLCWLLLQQQLLASNIRTRSGTDLPLTDIQAKSTPSCRVPYLDQTGPLALRTVHALLT